MTREEKQEFTLRISGANSTEMVVILYDMLLCYVQDGLDHLELSDENQTSFDEAIRKAKNCLRELIHSINPQFEPGPGLLGLCGYCIRRLTSAQIRRSREPLYEIKKIIVPIRDAFEEISARNTMGPVMDNTQTVYSGLTYGKNRLTENMADQSSNRGMYA